MIVDSPILADLALGADRVIPQEGDAAVQVPSIVMPVVTPLFRHDVANASTDKANTSKIAGQQGSFINVAIQTDNVIVLPKGLYTLEMNLACRGNFTTAVLAEMLEIILTYQGFDMRLAALPVNTSTANLETKRTLLLSSEATLKVRTPATNAIATNAIAYKFSVGVIRHF